MNFGPIERGEHLSSVVLLLGGAVASRTVRNPSRTSRTTGQDWARLAMLRPCAECGPLLDCQGCGRMSRCRAGRSGRGGVNRGHAQAEPG
jgi:hypothetical protein